LFCANRLLLVNCQKTKFLSIKPSKAQLDINGLNLLIHGIGGVGFEEENSKFIDVLLEESLVGKQHRNHINKNNSKSLSAKYF